MAWQRVFLLLLWKLDERGGMGDTLQRWTLGRAVAGSNPGSLKKKKILTVSMVGWGSSPLNGTKNLAGVHTLELPWQRKKPTLPWHISGENPETLCILFVGWVASLCHSLLSSGGEGGGGGWGGGEPGSPWTDFSSTYTTAPSNMHPL